MAEYVIEEPSDRSPSWRVHERIVRCRDCKYATVEQSDHDLREPLWCGFHRMDVKPDSFCKWGVPKEES